MSGKNNFLKNEFFENLITSTSKKICIRGLHRHEEHARAWLHLPLAVARLHAPPQLHAPRGQAPWHDGRTRSAPCATSLRAVRASAWPQLHTAMTAVLHTSHRCRQRHKRVDRRARTVFLPIQTQTLRGRTATAARRTYASLPAALNSNQSVRGARDAASRDATRHAEPWAACAPVHAAGPCSASPGAGLQTYVLTAAVLTIPLQPFAFADTSWVQDGCAGEF